MSIKPKYCELIASGKKTVEVRKTKPKIDLPFKCYIYCTKDNKNTFFIKHVFNGKKEKWAIFYEGKGKVIGEFVCDTIHEFTKAFFDEQGPQDTEEIGSCLNQFELSYNELCSYVGTNDFYGWHITDLVIYNNPKELGEFKKAGFMTEEQWLYNLYPNTHCHYEAWAKRFDITKPPQSYMFVEKLGE